MHFDVLTAGDVDMAVWESYQARQSQPFICVHADTHTQAHTHRHTHTDKHRHTHTHTHTHTTPHTVGSSIELLPFEGAFGISGIGGGVKDGKGGLAEVKPFIGDCCRSGETDAPYALASRNDSKIHPSSSSSSTLYGFLLWQKTDRQTDRQTNEVT